jgi:hypothetical protein
MAKEAGEMAQNYSGSERAGIRLKINHGLQQEQSVSGT